MYERKRDSGPIGWCDEIPLGEPQWCRIGVYPQHYGIVLPQPEEISGIFPHWNASMPEELLKKLADTLYSMRLAAQIDGQAGLDRGTAILDYFEREGCSPDLEEFLSWFP